MTAPAVRVLRTDDEFAAAAQIGKLPGSQERFRWKREAGCCAGALRHLHLFRDHDATRAFQSASQHASVLDQVAQQQCANFAIAMPNGRFDSTVNHVVGNENRLLRVNGVQRLADAPRRQRLSQYRKGLFLHTYADAAWIRFLGLGERSSPTAQRLSESVPVPSKRVGG